MFVFENRSFLFKRFTTLSMNFLGLYTTHIDCYATHTLLQLERITHHPTLIYSKKETQQKTQK
jgi:hypothetical protein